MMFDELHATAADRSRIYWMLSRFFVEPPSPAFLAELGMAAETPEAESEPGLAGALAALRQSLERADAENLGAEFVRLFRGIQEGYGPPPPYESLHREGRLMGETTERVVSHYRHQGFETVEESVGPQDHIGAELKYLAFLCHRESAAWERGETDSGQTTQAVQRDFLDKHLLRWVPEYCRRVQSDTKVPYFQAVADLTARTIEQDFQQICAGLSDLATGAAEGSKPKGEEQ